MTESKPTIEASGFTWALLRPNHWQMHTTSLVVAVTKRANRWHVTCGGLGLWNLPLSGPEADTPPEQVCAAGFEYVEDRLQQWLDELRNGRKSPA